MKGQSLTIAFIFLCSLAIAKTTPTEFANKQAPLSFIENKGQVYDQNRQPRTDIQFSLKATGGLNIFIGNGAIHYQFSKTEIVAKQQGLSAFPNADTTARAFAMPYNKSHQPDSTTYTLYRMDVELMGANQNAQVITEGQQEYYENYFTDVTGEKGATAHAFTKVIYKNIYPNIDWTLFIKDGKLEHEFTIHAGGKVSDIQLKYGGATDLKINGDGSLMAVTPQGIITEQAPVSYQADGKVVKSSFVLKGDLLSYGMDSYVGKLLIDPTLIWATYVGPSNTSGLYAVASDSTGNIYVAGLGAGTVGIATNGAYQTTVQGGTDCFMAKYTNGGAIVWATYYGGNSNERIYSIGVDSIGYLYVGGTTTSNSGIATNGSYQANYVGGSTGENGFLAKFSVAGARQWATYYSGNVNATVVTTATDKAGNTYITGATNSTSGIATTGTYQTSLNSTVDGYIAKFNTNGARIWGTYYGGNSDSEYAASMAVDKTGNLYVAGITYSTSGIASSGAYNTVASGNSQDIFLVKFNTSGARQWATYYGGTNTDAIPSVAIDTNGYIFMSGVTCSATGIATPGAYRSQHAGTMTDWDAFLTKFSSAGNLIWGTYYGGIKHERSVSLTSDGKGNAYIAGYTSSLTDIATPGAYLTMLNNHESAFLTKINGMGIPQWGTYYWSNVGDAEAEGITTDRFNNIYIIGNQWDDTLYSSSKDFLAKFDNCPAPTSAGKIIGGPKICRGDTIVLTNTVPNGSWFSSNTSVAKVDTLGRLIAVGLGNATITYRVRDTCGTMDTSVVITVSPIPSATLAPVGTVTVCQGDSVVFLANSGIRLTYQWQLNGNNISNATAGSYSAKQTGNYSVIVTDTNGCSAVSVPYTTTVKSSPSAIVTANRNTVLCQGDSVILTAEAGNSYLWSNNSTAQFIRVTQTGNYSVTLTGANGCSATSAAMPITVNPLPTATITASGNTTFCQGDSITLSVGVATNYLWSTNDTVSSITVKQSGDYTITVTDANSCSVVSAVTTITANPSPSAVITSSGSNTLCQGDSVILSAPSGGNYLWSTNVTGQNIIAYQSGQYAVTVTASNGCSASSSLIITVNLLPVPHISLSGNNLITGTTGTYQWYLNDSLITGAMNSIHIPLQSGTYYLLVTDSNGCAGKSNTINFTLIGISNITPLALTITPNPTTNTIAITGITPHQINIINTIGQTVATYQQTNTVSLGNLANGIYLLQLMDKDGKVIANERVVKQGE